MRYGCPECGNKVGHSICRKCGGLFRVCDYVNQTNWQWKYELAEYWYWWRALFVDTPKKFFNEDSWREAVDYFDGCAICGTHGELYKGHWVAAQWGGKHYDTNIIPLCAHCLERCVGRKHPFDWFTRDFFGGQQHERIRHYFYDRAGIEYLKEGDKVTIKVKCVEDTSYVEQRAVEDFLQFRRELGDTIKVQREGRSLSNLLIGYEKYLLDWD